MFKHSLIAFSTFMISCQNNHADIKEEKILQVTKFKLEMTDLKDCRVMF